MASICPSSKYCLASICPSSIIWLLCVPLLSIVWRLSVRLLLNGFYLSVFYCLAYICPSSIVWLLSVRSPTFHRLSVYIQSAHFNPSLFCLPSIRSPIIFYLCLICLLSVCLLHLLTDVRLLSDHLLSVLLTHFNTYCFKFYILSSSCLFSIIFFCLSVYLFC